MSDARVWYITVDGATQGPFTAGEVRDQLQAGSINPQTYVFRQGLGNWIPLAQAPELGAAAPVPPLPRAAAPASAAGAPAGPRCHEIDYQIHGDDMQFVDVVLDPGEAVIAEAGTMMYITNGIQMETRFTDGSSPDKGFMGKLLDAGKRVVTGESLFLTLYTNRGAGRETAAFAAPYPGKIIVADLKEHDGTLICQKDSFLCAAYGTSLGIAFTKRLGAGFFGGEGFILQKMEGDGKVFIHACGTIVKRVLGPGETLRVDTGCLVAMDRSVTYDIQFVGSVKTAFFGGEGLFFVTLTGPGQVFLQSLPFSRLADRIYSHAPSAGGSRKEEGSVLGGLGSLLGGDR
ncbi:MAG TPA: TIGR00266 family protein [Acidobacteriota bacterium]|nr:TIGR00266 family protein [Acidobacteriota bacterium]